MKIWLINHYAVPPQYYPLARPSQIAKNLIEMGHKVTIISASTVHNSNCQNLIDCGERVKKITDNGIDYVLINCTSYKGNGIKRVKNILEFSKRLPGILSKMDKPDAIVATSFDPLTCYQGIKYAKKNGITAVAEIADLWPETLVAYNNLSKNNILVRYLRSIEKKIYTLSDAIVFTMENAYDYIIEQKWENEIPKSKVFYINNGIDLKQYDENLHNYRIADEDLDNEELFKVVYTGSIRKVNNVGMLLDVAKQLKNPKICLLIWGEGDQKSDLLKRVEKEGITNVKFKGRVDKKYIPYITSKADLNIIHNEPSPIFRFGISFNKMFDYLAAGKPMLTDFPSKNNPSVVGGAGIDVDDATISNIAKAIDDISVTPSEQLSAFGRNARLTAEKYDFKLLTKKLADVIAKGEK